MVVPVLNLPSAHRVHWVSSLSFVESLPGVKYLASSHVVALALQDVAVSLYSPFLQVVQVVSSLALSVLSPAVKYSEVEQSVSVFLSWQDWAVVVPVLNLPSAHVVHWASSLSFVESLPGVKYLASSHVVALSSQLPVRWPVSSWYLPASQAAHEPEAVADVAVMKLPAAQVVCALQVVVRWPLSSWYVSVPQLVQVPGAVEDVPPMYVPAAQVVWSLQASRWLASSWYRCLSGRQLLQEPTASLLAPWMYLPASHCTCAVHVVTCAKASGWYPRRYGSATVLQSVHVPRVVKDDPAR